MAGKSKSGAVTLTSPDGVDVEATDPATVNNLVYGAGYKPRSGSIDDAIAAVSAPAPAAATTDEPTQKRGDA